MGQTLRVCVIGVGKMGEALLSGLSKPSSFAATLSAVVRSPVAKSEVERRFPAIHVSTDAVAAVRGSDVVLICVKPQQAQALIEAISPALDSSKTLISVCASLTVEQLESWSQKKCLVVRAMPNTPCVIGEGMTVLAASANASRDRLLQAERIFQALGKTALLEESLMDAATGLSGCGPAYAYLIIEALADAGVKVGLPRKLALELTAQTLVGASRMVLERGEHPAALRDEVTTPSGCTVEGLLALEEGKLRVTLIKAVMAATERSRSMKNDAKKGDAPKSES